MATNLRETGRGAQAQVTRAASRHSRSPRPGSRLCGSTARGRAPLQTPRVRRRRGSWLSRSTTAGSALTCTSQERSYVCRPDAEGRQGLLAAQPDLSAGEEPVEQLVDAVECDLPGDLGVSLPAASGRGWPPSASTEWIVVSWHCRRAQNWRGAGALFRKTRPRGPRARSCRVLISSQAAVVEPDHWVLRLEALGLVGADVGLLARGGGRWPSGAPCPGGRPARGPSTPERWEPCVQAGRAGVRDEPGQCVADALDALGEVESRCPSASSASVPRRSARRPRSP